MFMRLGTVGRMFYPEGIPTPFLVLLFVRLFFAPLFVFASPSSIALATEDCVDFGPVLTLLQYQSITPNNGQ